MLMKAADSQCATLLACTFSLPMLSGSSEPAFAITYDCTTLSIAGGTTHASGINNVGAFARSGSTASHGFVRDVAGDVQPIDHPSATSTSLSKIDNNGVAVGSAWVPSKDGETHSLDIGSAMLAAPPHLLTDEEIAGHRLPRRGSGQAADNVVPCASGQRGSSYILIGDSSMQ